MSFLPSFTHFKIATETENCDKADERNRTNSTVSESNAVANSVFAGYKKSSMQVSLLLLGGLAVSGCDRQTRYEYANRDDCVKDWGETECNEHNSMSSGSGGSGGSRYYYYRNDNATPRAGSNVQSVTRGGFGRSGGGGS